MALKAPFAAIVGERNALVEPAALRTYECDGLTRDARAASGTSYFPQSTSRSRGRRAGGREPRHADRGARRGDGTLGRSAPGRGRRSSSAVSRMTRILDLDLPNRRTRVQPGVINLDVTQGSRGRGYYYAPDPSSQASARSAAT